MTNKHIKKCSIFLAIKEKKKQNIIVVLFHHKLSSGKQTANAGEDVEKKTS
jgi:hypothetical protein